MELKTLKDLDQECKYDMNEGCIHCIRQEAIKHVREINEEIILFPLMSMGLERTRYWIKHFFNITAEELNEN